MDWNFKELTGTLRAEMGGHPPVVVTEEDDERNDDRKEIL